MNKMPLSDLYFTTQDLDSYFVNRDTGLPLANGILTFYQDNARTVLQPVYTLTGAPPYNSNSYVALPNPIILSAVGTVQDAGGDNVPIYYYPYNPITGDLSLYYVVCTDQYGNEQFTREAWPNITSENTPTQLPLQSASSFLTGWDFPLNSSQFGSSGTVYPMSTVTQSQSYIMDQTIAEAATTNVSWASDPITGGLSFTTSATSDAFYILQYLSGDEVKKMIGITMSVNVFGYVFGAALPVTMQIYLFRAPSTSTIPTLPATIGSVASNGTFSLTATGWDSIPRGGLPVPNVTLSQVLTNTDINNSSNNYGFNGYQITNSIDIDNTNLFAMVVTFSYSGSTVITVNSVSLVPGDVPSLPAIQSPDEVLRQCQYYYQKSFFPSVVPVVSAGLNSGESYAAQTVGASLPSSTGIIVRFPTPMRISPSITLYNPVSANNQIYNIFRSADWSSSLVTTTTKTQNGFCASGVTNAGSSVGDLIGVHWSADCRLGII
jgi:hypothetical protein